MMSIVLAACLTTVDASPARGQDAATPQHQHTAAASGPAWTWTPDANVFFGFNVQDRRFDNFSAWESQNWFMLDGRRPLGRGQLAVGGMISLEPFTMKALGSPQVFQTGESYHHSPLIDYQHPHDLLMRLGATYRLERGPIAYVVGADLVGSPALGPTVFMHRESARENPQAPLTHHHLDATHTTAGVLRAGIDLDRVSLEGSWFRGEEPDDKRLNLGRPRLDSWSARASWHDGPWQAQVSGGHLQQPEWFDPYDVMRLTASISFTGAVGSRPLAATIAWGENREPPAILDGYLFEWDLRATRATSIYGRTELAAKDIFNLGVPEVTIEHGHRISRVAALTLGYLRDVSTHSWGRLGIGADATVYHTSSDLRLLYGAPHSFHAFARYRPNPRAPDAHVH
jgi:hypothetical protein